MKQLLLSFLLLTVIKVATAQSSGQIAYKMDFSSDNPDMAMATTMMEGSTMDLFFIPGKSKLDVKMGALMDMTTVTDSKSDKTLMLMSMMGSKIAVESKLTKTDKEAKPDIKAKITTETKEIIGFKCTKATIQTEDGKELTIWYTTELNASLAGLDQFANLGVKGLPLEFSTEQSGMTVTFTATKFDKKVDEKIFSLVIPEGYTLMSEEELEKMGQL
jgi:GLPGLI family protein